LSYPYGEVFHLLYILFVYELNRFSQGAGYGVVIGLGALFALGMIGISEVMKRRGNVENSEEFTGKPY